MAKKTKAIVPVNVDDIAIQAFKASKFKAKPSEAVIESVIDELEAPHLLPSGIETRLLGGTSAAAFGLFTLLSQPRFEGGPQQ